jgi:hypothetical protein
MSSRKRSGQITRGKTALNRLRQIDVYCALALENTFVGGVPLVIDLGYGAYPWTALELYDRLVPLNPHLRVLGIEIDPERVTAALPYADPPRLNFALGGFNVTNVLQGERARMIRAYNVLRQYDESAVIPALRELSVGLENGGVLIEGTCNPTGRIVAFDVYRKFPDALRHEALVFGTNFRGELDPAIFQTILPKRLIHHSRDPQPATFFRDWGRAWRIWGGGRTGWVKSAITLRREGGHPVMLRWGLLRRGYLVLSDPLQGGASLSV